MQISSLTQPSYDNHFADWMRRFDFNVAATLSCPENTCFGTPGLSSNEHQGLLFQGDVQTLLYRLQGRVYGRGGNHRELHYAVFYECWTRAGWPTNWHAHCLFGIPDDFMIRFETQAERQWARILGPSFHHRCIDIKHIDDIAGAASYATKFALSGVMFDMCLPTAAAAPENK